MNEFTYFSEDIVVDGQAFPVDFKVPEGANFTYQDLLDAYENDNEDEDGVYEVIV